jgi:hypothetical protein
MSRAFLIIKLQTTVGRTLLERSSEDDMVHPSSLLAEVSDQYTQDSIIYLLIVTTQR